MCISLKLKISLFDSATVAVPLHKKFKLKKTMSQCNILNENFFSADFNTNFIKGSSKRLYLKLKLSRSAKEFKNDNHGKVFGALFRFFSSKRSMKF